MKMRDPEKLQGKGKTKRGQLTSCTEDVYIIKETSSSPSPDKSIASKSINDSQNTLSQDNSTSALSFEKNATSKKKNSFSLPSLYFQPPNWWKW